MKKINCIILACLLIAIATVSYVGANLSQLVYMVGTEQTAAGVSKLVAQDPSLQQVLDVYNLMKSANPLSAVNDMAQRQICKSGGDVCNKIAEITDVYNKVELLEAVKNDPAQFAAQLAQQEFCKKPENQASCSSYTAAQNALGTASQLGDAAKNPSFIKDYAIGIASQKLSSSLGTQLTQVIQYKKYLDILILEPNEKVAQQNDITGEAVAETGESFTIKPENRKLAREQCMVGLNLLKGSFSPGTFDDIYNCKTSNPKGTDLSTLMGLRAGVLFVGPSCILSKTGQEMTIKTVDAKTSPENPAEAASCYVKLGTDMFKNLLGNTRVEKGPEEYQTIESAIIVANTKGELVHAEFEVAKEATEYTFAGKKYKLPKGTTVIYDNGEVKFGFAYVKDPNIELFSFNKNTNKWAASGKITGTSLAPVKVEPLADGRYKISGKFKAIGMKDITVGENSDATLEGVTVRTKEASARITVCSTAGEGNWIDYCKKGKIASFTAQGNGFAFGETIRNGRYYYMKGGSIGALLEEKGKGKYKRFGVGEGNFVYTMAEGYVESQNGVLTQSLDYKTYEMGVTDKTGATVKKLGAKGLQDALDTMLVGGAAPDALKGLIVLSDNPDVEDDVMVLKDAKLAAFGMSTGACMIPVRTGTSSVTGESILDITGKGVEEIQAQIEKLNKPSKDCDQPGEMKVNAVTAPIGIGKVEINDEGEVLINGEVAGEISYKDTAYSKYLDPSGKKYVGLLVVYTKELENRYLIDPNSGSIYFNWNDYYRYNSAGSAYLGLEEIMDNMPDSGQRKEAEIDVKAAKSVSVAMASGETAKGPLIFITDSAGPVASVGSRWRFTATHNKWMCTALGSDPCPPSSDTMLYVKCVHKATKMEFMWAYDSDCAGDTCCPAGSAQYAKEA